MLTRAGVDLGAGFGWSGTPKMNGWPAIRPADFDSSIITKNEYDNR